MALGRAAAGLPAVRVRVEVTRRCDRRAARHPIRAALGRDNGRRWRGPGGSTGAGPGYCKPAGTLPGSCEVTALDRVTARRPGRPGCCKQVTLYVFVAPPATHGLGCRAGGEVRGPVARAARPGASRTSPAEGVEVVTPAAPSALQLESDGYPRRKQPVHPNK